MKADLNSLYIELLCIKSFRFLILGIKYLLIKVKQMEHKDKRLKWTSEILSGIKVSLIDKG